MKYRAICPSCGFKLPRKLYFGWLSHIRRQCPSCSCRYTADLRWEHIGSALLGLSFGIPFLLAFLGMLSWPVATLLFLAAVLNGYFWFPYVTPFVLIERKKEDETHVA